MRLEGKVALITGGAAAEGDGWRVFHPDGSITEPDGTITRPNPDLE